MTKTLKTTKTALHPCACSLFEFDLQVESDDDYNTGCTAMTHRMFAQGHDAKLVGFLVRADLAGHDISKREGGMLSTFQNSVHAAGTISEALAAKTQAMLDAQIARALKKAVKKAPKPAQEEIKSEVVIVDQEPEAREAKIKVGRWTYDATIQPNGDATYASKLGGTKTALVGAYTLV